MDPTEMYKPTTSMDPTEMYKPTTSMDPTEMYKPTTSMDPTEMYKPGEEAHARSERAAQTEHKEGKTFQTQRREH